MQLSKNLIAIIAAALLAAPVQADGLTPSMQCDGIQVLHEDGPRNPLQSRSFGINDRGLCSQYTRGGGWERPLNLYLGEDAADYSAWVGIAAGVWSEALGFEPGINIVEGDQPRTSRVSDSAWRRGSSIPSNNVQDRQSVIYIKNEAGTEDDLAHGFCITRMSRSGNRIEEADIYIKAPGITSRDRMAIPSVAAYVNSEHAVYSVVDDLYSTILHEMGHAVGLKHVRSPGNLMSLAPHTAGLWDPVSLRLYAESQLRTRSGTNANPATIPYVFPLGSLGRTQRILVNTEKIREAWFTFSLNLGLGPQDRTALMCIYEIE